jgi:hypothetical protein
MSCDNNDNVSPIFSGGEVLIGPKVIDGDAELIKKETPDPHPWIAATSHPKPPETRPRPVDRFELEVKRDGDKPSIAKARCASMDQLLDLSQQFEGIGYHFVRLERLTEEASKSANE